MKCYETTDFVFEISWMAIGGEWRKANVSQNSYNIAGLSPNTEYVVTVVAMGDRVRSEARVTDVKTSGECKETQVIRC